MLREYLARKKTGLLFVHPTHSKRKSSFHSVQEKKKKRERIRANDEMEK